MVQFWKNTDERKSKKRWQAHQIDIA
jgi:hypothetical protein